jgi:hypothetical protein
MSMLKSLYKSFIVNEKDRKCIRPRISGRTGRQAETLGRLERVRPVAQLDYF